MRSFILITICLFVSNSIQAQEDEELGWPREIDKKGYYVLFYQPQLESFEENMLEGRMAVSIKKKDGQPVFGAAWFKTRVDTDYDTRMVSFEDLSFTDSKFPEVKEENYKGLKDLIIKEIGKWDLEMSMDRFMLSLDGLKEIEEGLDDSEYDNTPPTIYFRKEPAVLIMVDGGPTLKPTDEANLMTVVNTPYFLLLDTKKSKYYLAGGEWWWESEKVESGWEKIKKPPKHVRKYYDKQRVSTDTELDSVALEMENPPEVIVSTEPAELIMSDGEPEFKSVEGTELLYLSNSESDVLMHIKAQQYYVLLAGRWFRAGSLDSKEWTFINPYKLPEEFQNISEDSDIANVRVSIPQTQESKEAILESAVPQTAEIDRATATVMVKYDGDPKFEQIEGTDVYYAINTEKDVLMLDKTYYCVDDAVWFIASKATGPWSVADSIPDEIYDIPASSPVHNVTYVYIYESTPDVVYVGYTPGYYGSYVSNGVIIYGTGYYYQPWYGRYYYPRSVTYGYGVHYNPYTGWGFTVGVSYGWVHYGGYGGYWGRGGYRYGYRHGYAHGAHRGYRAGYNAGRRAGYQAGSRGATARSSNAYRNRSNGVRSTGGKNVGNTGGANRTTANQGARRSNQPNNVYSDRSGNTYRRQDNGSWQQRNNGNGQWQDRAGSADRSSAGNRAGATDRTGTGNRTGANTGSRAGSGTQNRSYNQGSMNRDYNSRSRGTTRSNNYQRSGASRGGMSGGARRGGRR